MHHQLCTTLPIRSIFFLASSASLHHQLSLLLLALPPHLITQTKTSHSRFNPHSLIFALHTRHPLDTASRFMYNPICNTIYNRNHYATQLNTDIYLSIRPFHRPPSLLIETTTQGNNALLLYLSTEFLFSTRSLPNSDFCPKREPSRHPLSMCTSRITSIVPASWKEHHNAPLSARLLRTFRSLHLPRLSR